MKKFITMVLVAVMVLGISAAAYADTKDASVYYTVTESFEWSIKADLTTGDGLLLDGTSQEVTDAVTVTKNVIGAGKKLKITVSSANDWKVKEATLLNTLNYVLSKTSGGASVGSDPILVVDAGVNTGSVDLFFKLTKDTVEKAGNYKDTLTFTATVE